MILFYLQHLFHKLVCFASIDCHVRISFYRIDRWIHFEYQTYASSSRGFMACNKGNFNQLILSTRKIHTFIFSLYFEQSYFTYQRTGRSFVTVQLPIGLLFLNPWESSASSKWIVLVWNKNEKLQTKKNTTKDKPKIYVYNIGKRKV